MTLYYEDESVTLYHGDTLDVLRQLPDGSVDCCVTSPPYFGLRDYGVAGQYGLEASPVEYVETMRAVFGQVRRVLADDGTLWLNIGDSYSSGGRSSYDTNGGKTRARGHAASRPVSVIPDKNLLGIPWRVAFALQDDGWILRNAIIWHKLTAMPESVTDRLSTRYEHVFLFSKSRRYWFDLDAIREQLAHPEAADGTRVFGGTQGGQGKVGSAYRTGGGMPNSYGRPQRARAEQIAREKGLTQAHFDAIRAVGVTDTGKANATQSGAGKNRPEVQALADEAKAALGGYYREFLTPTGKNPGDVWSISAQPFAEAHFAVMPPSLAERCVKAGCKPGGTVLDTFSGSGTTGAVAARLGRRYVGIDLNRDYLDMSLRTRLAQSALVDGGAS